MYFVIQEGPSSKGAAFLLGISFLSFLLPSPTPPPTLWFFAGGWRGVGFSLRHSHVPVFLLFRKDKPFMLIMTKPTVRVVNATCMGKYGRTPRPFVLNEANTSRLRGGGQEGVSRYE